MSSVVPEGWSYSKISEIGTVVTGSTPSTTESSYWGGAIPFVSPADFDGTVYVRQTGRTVTERGAQKGRILPKDSILVTCIGSLGGIAISSEISVTNQQINAIVPSNENDNRFTYYNVLFHIDELEKNAGTTTLPIINKSTFGSITLPIPPLPEQKKIASILTSVDEVIENTQKQIDKLQDLKKATMNELLTKGIGHTEFKDSELGRIPKSWEVVPCSEVFDFMNGKAFYSDGYSDSGYRVIDLLNISLGGRLNITLKDKFISAELYKKFLKAQLRKDDLIFIMTDITPSLGLIGKTAIIDKDNSYVLNQRVGCFRPRLIESLYIRFFNYLFNSNVMRLQVVRETLGTAQFYINTPAVKNLLLKVPPLHEQMKITSILDSVERRIDGQETLLLKTQSLKKSLMQDLLTGKVRVTVN